MKLSSESRVDKNQAGLEQIRYFIESGGDSSAKDEQGKTFLVRAVEAGHLEVGKFLLSKEHHVMLRRPLDLRR